MPIRANPRVFLRSLADFAFTIASQIQRLVLSVGPWVIPHMRTDFVLDTLEQTLYERKPQHADGLIHHSDRGDYHSTATFQQTDYRLQLRHKAEL